MNAASLARPPLSRASGALTPPFRPSNQAHPHPPAQPQIRHHRSGIPAPPSSSALSAGTNAPEFGLHAAASSAGRFRRLRAAGRQAEHRADGLPNHGWRFNQALVQTRLNSPKFA